MSRRARVVRAPWSRRPPASAATTAAALGVRLRNEVDLAGLEADLTATIALVLRPGSTAVWIRKVRLATPTEVP